MHDVAPSFEEYEPIAQVTHDAEAVASWYLPAAHFWQEAEPAEEYSPL
jgi:hypothetical protein